MKQSLKLILVLFIFSCLLAVGNFRYGWAAPQFSQTPLQISINRATFSGRTGDTFEFETYVVNEGLDKANSIVVAMNIVNLEGGSPVDPEDWSPKRTQTIKSLKAGSSATQVWKISAILKGNYLIYLVAVPKPNNANETVQPAASQAIHMTVKDIPRLNPDGVLPVVLGVPITMAVILTSLRWLRRRDR